MSKLKKKGPRRICIMNGSKESSSCYIISSEDTIMGCWERWKVKRGGGGRDEMVR